MDTALPQKFPFILDGNLAKANCTGNRVCTSCDIVVLESGVRNELIKLVSADGTGPRGERDPHAPETAPRPPPQQAPPGCGPRPHRVLLIRPQT